MADIPGAAEAARVHMNPKEKLDAVEQKYRKVLELAQKQLVMLTQGKLEDLPMVLQLKSDSVEEAGLIMAQLREVQDPLELEMIQEGLTNLAKLMSQVMEIEDQCQKLCSPHAAAASTPPSRAASLYRRNVR